MVTYPQFPSLYSEEEDRTRLSVVLVAYCLVQRGTHCQALIILHVFRHCFQFIVRLVVSLRKHLHCSFFPKFRVN